MMLLSIVPTESKYQEKSTGKSSFPSFFRNFLNPFLNGYSAFSTKFEANLKYINVFVEETSSKNA